MELVTFWGSCDRCCKHQGLNEACSVFITLEAYLDFFSAPFLNSSLSTGVGRLDRAFGCVIRTPMKVFPFSIQTCGYNIKSSSISCDGALRVKLFTGWKNAGSVNTFRHLASLSNSDLGNSDLGIQTWASSHALHRAVLLGYAAALYSPARAM